MRVFVAALCALLPLASSSGLQTRWEAEDGQLAGGDRVDTKITGFSGTGYVTNITAADATITIQLSLDPNLYEVFLGYHSTQDKGYELDFGGQKGMGMLPATGSQWGKFSAGHFLVSPDQRTANSTATATTLTLKKGWGWYELDYVDVVVAHIEPPKKPGKDLVDPAATAEARSLISYLVDKFGTAQLSGQYGLSDIQYVQSVTGLIPAVNGFDLIDYSPSRIEHGADPGNATETWLAWLGDSVDGGAIPTLSWHWNAPCHLIDTEGKEWWRGFYTYATTFDIEWTLANPTSDEYTKLLRDLDAIAVQLAKFQEGDMPMLWRPLHEAAGGWFWWGAKGPDAFKQLWRLMFTRFTQTHKLHHLVWVYTADPSQPDWYPGDDVVDVVGMDIYTTQDDSMDQQWQLLRSKHEGVKLLTLSESGTLPLPRTTALYQTWWSWWSVWSGDFIRNASVHDVYHDPSIITVATLPDWRHYNV